MDKKAVAKELVRVAKLLSAFDADFEIEDEGDRPTGDDISYQTSQLNTVADMFSRYLLGDKRNSISKLQSLNFKTKNVPDEMSDEYNQKHGELHTAILKTLKMHL